MKNKLDLFLDTIIKEDLYPSKGNLLFHLDTIFKGIDFRNKRFLDIGGGYGIHSFYAGCKGAKEVLCIEPEFEGSSSKTIEKYRYLNNILKLKNVRLETKTIQDFEPSDTKFDIILLHNSINHLNEYACINLLKEDSSKSIYISIFSKISLLSNNGAKIIICDCSRYNFYAMLKIINPFVRTIEWHKHQSPETWISLLKEVGFIKPKIKWTSFNTLRFVGRIFIGNRIMSYFLNSHFCLRMEKQIQKKTTI
jgi:SAM-dependent methyltransferase